MIVADTSALISLASCDTLDLFFDEFDAGTTKTVVEELEELAEHEDRAAENAKEILGQTGRFTIHDVEAQRFQSSRIDEGEGSCVKLSHKTEAKFLITDDLRALPELQTLTETRGCHLTYRPEITCSKSKSGKGGGSSTSRGSSGEAGLVRCSDIQASAQAVQQAR